MNPPSDVTVLSVIEPRLSLPLLEVLEVSASIFFGGRGGSTGRAVAEAFVDAFVDTGGDDVFVVTGGDILLEVEGCVEETERRRSRLPGVSPSAMTLDTEDETVDAGGRAPEFRRGRRATSRSMCFRLGDELDDPGGFSDSARISRRFCTCSIVDVVGTEVDAPPPPLPPDPRELLLAMDDATICGLPPERPFPGIGTEADLPALLFLRSADGLAVGPDRTGLTDGTGLPRDVRLSSNAFTSGGMGMWWTRLTDRQSAGCIRRCSLAVGGRQQPGHPVL